MTSASTLPDDIEALKAMLRERDVQVARLQETVDSQLAALASRAAAVPGEQSGMMPMVCPRRLPAEFGREAVTMAELENLGRDVVERDETDVQMRPFRREAPAASCLVASRYQSIRCFCSVSRWRCSSGVCR
jgi:hypothetical protein